MSSETQHKVAGERYSGCDSPDTVREELDRVLRSDAFNATPKRRAMLTFLIEEALAGRADTLKGYAIGIAVFDRDENFDPQSDPIVRLEARRLRHDLDSYYVADGAENPIRISIPKGQYAPRFHTQTAEESLTAAEEEAAVAGTGTQVEHKGGISTEPAAKRFVATFGILALTAVVLAALVVAAALVPRTWYNWAAKPWADEPSIMVLPFEINSENSDEAMLARGIANEITTGLSQFSGFQIFLPPTDPGNGAPANPVETARRGGVAYLVVGAVETEDNLVHVSAKLVEADSGRILWTGSYERWRNRTTLMQIKHSISGEIASIIGQPYGIVNTELANSLPVAETSPSSYDCVLRGYVYRRTFSAALHAKVKACLEQAVKKDPTYADAWAMLGWIYLDSGRFGFSGGGNPELAYSQALDAASHALTLDGRNVLALMAKSSINHYMGNQAESERLARQALEVNPNNPDTMAQLGWRLAVTGDFGEGIPYLQKAIERTVNAPGWYYHLIAIDHLLNDRPAQMLTAAKQGTHSNSGFSWLLVAIAQAELGNAEAARTALDNAAETSPGTYRNPTAFLKTHQADEQIVEAIMTGLEKAGWSAEASH